MISADGKNTRNLKKRIGKGIGIISKIMKILEKVTLGEHYITTDLLLRERLFINGILTNSEVWYGLTRLTRLKIKEIKDMDILLLRRMAKQLQMAVLSYLQVGHPC